jgi:ketosteroid isomerase-like protein
VRACAAKAFNEAFHQHDANGLAALIPADTVFEDTSPAADGKRIAGKAAVLEFWRGWFVQNLDAFLPLLSVG